MSDWLSAKTTIQTTKQYGKIKSGNTSNSDFIISSLQALQKDDFSPTLNTFGESRKNNSLKDINNNVMDAAEKKRKDREGCLVNGKKSSKVKMESKLKEELIETAFSDDLKYLYEQLQRYEETPHGQLAFVGLQVELPTSWAADDIARLEGWLHGIGFDTAVPEQSQRVSYTYPYKKVRPSSFIFTTLHARVDVYSGYYRFMN